MLSLFHTGLNLKQWSVCLIGSFTLIMEVHSIHPLPGMHEQTTFIKAEICDNGQDDDGDGLIDLNDEDCFCPTIIPQSLIPNPSFEETNCCPSSRSQLNCADTWIQASEATTDLIHMCGWMGWENFPPPLPFPDGDGIVGFRDGRVIQGESEPNWKEYAGACLLGPLKKNTTYRFEFHIGFVDPMSSPPINISFFGSTDCENLPFGIGDNFFGCPTNGPGWVKLGSRLVGGIGGGGWIKTSIDVTPREDIHAIAIGPDCQQVQTTTSLYYFFDNLVLDIERSFTFVITEIGHPCSADYRLRVPQEENLSYQWFADGIAIIGANSHELKAPLTDGAYEVRVLGDGFCQTTKAFQYRKPVPTEYISDYICEGEVYPFGLTLLQSTGSYIDTIPSAQGCDSIVYLDLDVIGMSVDTVDAKIFPGENLVIGSHKFKEPGNYMADLPSSLGCDSLVNLNLEYYHVYLPNVFTPNHDGTNDYFTISGGVDLLAVKRLTVFDRWGIAIYDKNNLELLNSPGWGGMHQGVTVNSGVYTYLAEIIMDDGIQRQLSGTVLLVR